MRLSLRLAFLPVALLGLLVGFAAPAAASQNVPFAVHKGPAANPDKWHAEVSGDVTFYGSRRKFDINGTGIYHHSPSNDHTGYTQVQEDVRNSTDPAYKTVTEGDCTFDTSVPLVTWTCDLGRSISNTTLPGHGLAGVRVRVCVSQPGVDPCGPVRYVDNPLT